MTETAVASLTGALVQSNDRLLGVLGLITADAPPSLQAGEMIDWILDRANSIVALDSVRVQGETTHCWGSLELPIHEWQDRPRGAAGSNLVAIYGRSVGRFDTADTKLLTAVTALIANAVATAELHQSQLEQRLLATEHATAARITTMALPDRDATPDIDGVSLFCDLVPARTTGGDLYTWHERDGDLWFALGDVSGKGLPAAVLMTSIVSMIEAAICRPTAHEPAQVMAEIERLMYRRLSDAAMFVTLALGHWTPATNELSILNCGHSPVAYLRNGQPEPIPAGAPPIGVIEGLLPDVWVTRTNSTDVLVLATDGFTEQTNQDGLMFGEQRFDRCLSQAVATSSTAPDIGTYVLDELAEFSAGCEQADDRALMVVQFS